MGDVLKTEHNGAKHGNGAWWGRKAEAKTVSNSRRRAHDARFGREARQRDFDESVEDTLRRYPRILAHLAQDD